MNDMPRSRWGSDVGSLGPPLAVYTASVSRILLYGIIAIGWAAFAGYAACHLIAEGNADLGAWAWILMIGLVGFGGLAFACWAMLVRVLLYPEGLVRITWRRAEGFRWDEVEEVVLSMDVCLDVHLNRESDGKLESAWLPFPRLIFFPWMTSIRFRTRDSTTVEFFAYHSGWRELFAEIQKETFRKSWPSVWASFCVGEVITFGIVSACQQGISVPGGTLPWVQLAQVGIKHGCLIIDKQGCLLTWYQSPNGVVIPNQHILFALAKEAIQNR